MARSYTIFFREKVILLTTDESSVSSDESSLFIRYDSIDDLKLAVQSFCNNNVISKLFVVAEDLEQLWNDFQSLFEIIEASGGLVKNVNDEILFIFRKGKWDLPKGKVEEGEKVTDAGIREVEEESGISGVSIVKEMISTYHIFVQKEKSILKRTHWYEMKVDGVPALNPQEEEGIIYAKWMKKKEIKEVLKNTYPSIAELLSAIDKS